jgi:hypothetical protein
MATVWWPKKASESNLELNAHLERQNTIKWLKVNTKSGWKDIVEVLDDDGTRSPEHCFDALEIVSTPNRENCKVTRKEIKALEVEAWLHGPRNDSMNDIHFMRVLLCPDVRLRPILDSMKLPEVYEAILQQHNARCFQIEEEEVNGFILHMRIPGFSFATTYDPKTSSSIGLVIGLSAEQINNLVCRLEASDLACWPPALVAVCLLEQKIAWVNESSVICYDRLLGTEETIGTKTNHLLAPVLREKDWLAKLDFDTIARDLTIISTALARVDHQCLVGEQMLRIVEAATLAFTTSPNNCNQQCSRLQTRTSELRSFFDVLRLEGQFYMRRTEANRQTVYSLIAQKDNQVNIQIARSSLVDSNSMKVIAEATARDSAAMVVISIVTIAFLPATFTATFFSTTFFNFQNQGQSVMSQWIWLYWVITAPLTIIIMGVWYLLSKKRGKTIQERLNSGFNGSPKIG